jgi:EAL domain-containing protein (putative c-di-GMP-specific phosphodiesterase class I)
VGPTRRALARALISFANDISATIIAEGIETDGEIDALHDLDVRHGQGYHLGRPAPMTWRPTAG